MIFRFGENGSINKSNIMKGQNFLITRSENLFLRKYNNKLKLCFV